MFSYFLVNGAPPRGVKFSMTGQPFRPENVALERFQNAWWLYENGQPLFAVGQNKYEAEQALEVIRTRPMADYQKHGYGRWACIDKASGQLIGFSGLKYLDDLQEVDLGYRFLPAYWGRGLATESGRAVLEYGFATLRLEQIIGLVAPENVASVRVLEKLGLTFVGMIEYFGKPTAKYAIEMPHSLGT